MCKNTILKSEGIYYSSFKLSLLFNKMVKLYELKNINILPGYLIIFNLNNKYFFTGIWLFTAKCFPEHYINLLLYDRAKNYKMPYIRKKFNKRRGKILCSFH